MKKPRIFCALAIVGMVCLSACTTAPNHQPSAALRPMQGETKETHARATLRPDDRSRTDVAGFYAIRTGEILAAVFSAPPAPNVPTIEIVSAGFDRSIADVGFTGVYTYHVTALLRAGTDKRILNATGIDKQHGILPPDVYAQTACERAVVELARQVNALSE